MLSCFDYDIQEKIMPKVNPFAGTQDFLEGETITKDGFRNFKERIDAVESVVDQDNIRQEGLDRRSFATKTWHKSLDKANTIAYVDESYILLDPVESGVWTRVRTSSSVISPDFATSGGEGRLMVTSTFDPEIDSHLIIRCSGVISSRQMYYVGEDDHFIDVGLRVRTADTAGSLVTRYKRGTGSASLDDDWLESGVVWPYQRISLNTAYSKFAEIGFRRSTSDFKGYTQKDDGDFEVHLISGSTEDSGAATEWMYDRKTYLHYNFHLLHHISSDANSGLSHLLQEASTSDLRFELMYRRTSTGGTSRFLKSQHLNDNSIEEMSSPYAKLSDCMLSVQTIRR